MPMPIATKITTPIISTHLVPWKMPQPPIHTDALKEIPSPPAPLRFHAQDVPRVPPPWEWYPSTCASVASDDIKKAMVEMLMLGPEAWVQVMKSRLDEWRDKAKTLQKQEQHLHGMIAKTMLSVNKVTKGKKLVTWSFVDLDG